MATWFISILSLGFTLLVSPFLWRWVIRLVRSRADALMARYKFVALHHDLLLRIYLIAGVLATAGLFHLTHKAFTTLHENLTPAIQNTRVEAPSQMYVGSHIQDKA
jgi:hypothetical protein